MHLHTVRLKLFETVVHAMYSSGGEVKFDVSNDAPTLTGAKITFTIDIRFPVNQKILPNGEVVWAKNCTVDGKLQIWQSKDKHHTQ